MNFSAIKYWHSWIDLSYLCPLTLLEMTFNKGQVIISHPELWGQQNVQVGHLGTLTWAYPSHEKSSLFDFIYDTEWVNTTVQR